MYANSSQFHLIYLAGNPTRSCRVWQSIILLAAPLERGEPSTIHCPRRHLSERRPLAGREIQEKLRLDQFEFHDRQPAQPVADHVDAGIGRSEEHTSELQSLMRISYAVFCLKKKITT